MRTIVFSTAKAGLEEASNEDAWSVRQPGPRALFITVSDGASTGVFSREWSHHLTGRVDSGWLQSPADYLKGLASLRESFRPAITRPTAERKFLLEGSYATLFSTIVRFPKWWFGRLKLRMFAIGDVTLFVIDQYGRIDFSFPQTKKEDFGNTPDLVRTHERLQEKTPFTLKTVEYAAASDRLVVLATDALGEYLFTLDQDQRRRLLAAVVRCRSQEQFRMIINYLRKKRNLKNDDVTICLVSARPDLHFPGVDSGSPGEAS